MSDVTSYGDKEIQDIGGSAEHVVAKWWEALPRADQLRVALASGADFGLEPGEKIQRRWKKLDPIGQQMRIHMWYDERGVGDE